MANRVIIALVCLLVNTIILAAQEAYQLAGKTYLNIDGTWFIEESEDELFQINKNSVTVKTKASFVIETLMQEHVAAGLKVQHIDCLGYCDLYVPDNMDVFAFVADCLASGYFDYVGINTIGKPLVQPDDTEFTNNEQWYLTNIKAANAWDLEYGASSVIVAVIDNGVRWDHNDLGPGADGYENMFINFADNDPPNAVDDDLNNFIDDRSGWNFIDYDPNLNQFGNRDSFNGILIGDADHGMGVAGIIAAKTNNSAGIAGIAGGWNEDGVRIMPLRTNTQTNEVRHAIIYATDNGADVINMSLSTTEAPPLSAAIEYAYSRGVIMVAGSGNGAFGTVRYPARDPFVIAVCGTKNTDERADLVLSGPEVDLSAPAVDIYTTSYYTGGVLDLNAYRNMSGTSFAGPQVAAAAALLQSINPCLSVEQIRSILQETADEVHASSDPQSIYNYNWNPGQPGKCIALGHGRLNVQAAVQSAKYYDDGFNGGGFFLQNGSFENCRRWHRPTLATPDFFSSDHNLPGRRVHTNDFGAQHAFANCQYNDGSEAYAGIHLTQSGGQQYKEYVQAKLREPLAVGASYRIAFRLSRAAGTLKHASAAYTPSGHSINKISAYLSSSEVLDYTTEGNLLDPATAPGQWVESNDQVNQGGGIPDFQLYNDGGPGDEEWMKVEDIVTISGNSKEYITIGNFQASWGSGDWYHPGPAPPAAIDMYYYIDCVEIELINPPVECLCAGSNYVVSVNPVHGESNENECCMEIYVTPPQDINTCLLDRIDVYRPGQPGSPALSFTPPLGLLPRGVKSKIGEICYDIADDGQQQTLNFDFWSSGEKCSDSKSFDLQCATCGCEDLPSGGFSLSWVKAEGTCPVFIGECSGCCWNLVLTNESDCDFVAGEIELTLDQFDVGDINWQSLPVRPFPGSGWFPRIDEAGKFVWANPGGTIKANTGPLVIGGLCIPDNTLEFEYHMQYVVVLAGTNPPVVCPREWEGTFYCGDCCDDYDVEFFLGDQTYVPVQCCMYIFSVDRKPGPNCPDPKVRLLLNDVEYNTWNNGVFQEEVCISDDIFTAGPSCHEVTIQILDNNNEVLCERSFVVCCERNVAGKQAQSLPDRRAAGTTLSIAPNPAFDEAEFQFELTDAGFVQLDILDAIGRPVRAVASGIYNPGRHKISYAIGTLPPGFYYVRLLNEGQAVVAPLTIMR